MSQLKDRRTSMRVTAENIVLNSGEWFTQNELNSIATCQQFELDEWELSGKYFPSIMTAQITIRHMRWIRKIIDR